MTRSGTLFAFALLAAAPFASAAPPAPGRAERCVAAAERGQQQSDHAAFLDARASFRTCSADECPALVRKDCVQWLADVETNIPTVVLGARDASGNDVAGAHVFVDGKSYQEEVDAGRAIALDPGPHTFRFEHGADAPAELTLVLRMGEHNRAIYGTLGAAGASSSPTRPTSAGAAPPPTASTTSTTTPVGKKHISAGAYALGAVAVAGGASFAIFGIMGLNEKSQLRAQCNDTCSDAAINPLKVDYITADVSLGIGIIAALVSGWLFLHPSVDPPTTSFAVAPTRDGASFSVGGRF